MRFWNFENTGSGIIELRIEGDIVDDDHAWLYEWWGDMHTAPNKFRQQLAEHEGKELHVIVDTYGGSVFAGTAIAADLKNRSGKTIGIVYSKAMSSGVNILMGCDEIWIAPGGVMMIHDPAISSGGDIAVLEKSLEVLNTLKDAILNMYEDKTGLTRQELSDMMSAETWMSATDAVDKGFADKVIETEFDIKNSYSIERMRFINGANMTLINRHAELQERSKIKELELYLETV